MNAPGLRFSSTKKYEMMFICLWYAANNSFCILLYYGLKTVGKETKKRSSGRCDLLERTRKTKYFKIPP